MTLKRHPSQVPQIRPLADIVHFKYARTYLLTYLSHWHAIHASFRACHENLKDDIDLYYRRQKCRPWTLF